jgi:iron(III) transport system ATP-binding protein
MTVIENVAYGPKVSGVPKRRAREIAAEKISLLGLSGLERRFPSELSGGQQQRVAVARALVLEPLLLLFDEPLSNLDAKLRRRVRDDIRDLQSRLNLTVVYVTHDQQEALAISDQVIVMAQAAIAQSGRPRDLYENPANVFVADFIGDANIVDAELAGCSGDRVQVRLAGLDFTLPGRNLTPGPVKLAVRPEAIRLYRHKPAGPALPARLLKAVYLGSHMEYTVDCVLGALFVIDRSISEYYATSSELWIRFCHSGVSILGD